MLVECDDNGENVGGCISGGSGNECCLWKEIDNGSNNSNNLQ